MEKVSVLEGITAPLLRANINTDILIRIERLITFPKGELGPYCFEAWRYRPDGSDDPDFVLNQTPYREATILLADDNFGCGSSREAAVWALWDMGFRCVIAPSFGGIFYNNCFQNGMLPIVLPADEISALAGEVEAAPGDNAGYKTLTVDLVKQTIGTPTGRSIAFTIDPARRQALLDGLDEIEMTLARDTEITAFQSRDRVQRPWIYEF